MKPRALQLELTFGRSESEMLRLLRREGASRLEGVAFRRNRSTIWSLTQNGRVLNLHEGYRGAPLSVVRAFVAIANHGHRSSGRYREACRVVRSWPGIDHALGRLRAHSTSRRRPRPVPCQGTPQERIRVRALYRRLNGTRFEDRLPTDIPIRISRRMKTRLGHMAPEGTSRNPTVGEIALNRMLFRGGNEAALEETLLHEMAHVAAYLFDGDSGHGPAWKTWALRAGCGPTPCIAIPVRA
ncbi:MAG: SprT-like domain-containing protein [Gemmatimonadetes bacterium]|nr:SprT-like domain-containing protein [Gemmatimonadota bacterium]